MKRASWTNRVINKGSVQARAPDPPDDFSGEGERRNTNELVPTVSEDDTVAVIVLVEGRLFESLSVPVLRDLNVVPTD